MDPPKQSINKKISLNKTFQMLIYLNSALLTHHDYYIDFVQEKPNDLYLFIQINSVSAAAQNKHSIEALL